MDPKTRNFGSTKVHKFFGSTKVHESQNFNLRMHVYLLRVDGYFDVEYVAHRILSVVISAT